MTSWPVGRGDGLGDLVGLGRWTAGEAEPWPAEADGAVGSERGDRGGSDDGVSVGATGRGFGVPAESLGETVAAGVAEGGAASREDRVGVGAAAEDGSSPPARRRSAFRSPQPPRSNPSTAQTATHLIRVTLVGRSSASVRFQGFEDGQQLRPRRVTRDRHHELATDRPHVGDGVRPDEQLGR